MSEKFPGLSELVKHAPEGGVVAGYTENAFVVRWNETERRWVQQDVVPTHYIKFPGEDWKALP